MNELENIDNINIDDLYNRIVTLIENAKRNVATTVNQEMTLLYWNIGKDMSIGTLLFDTTQNNMECHVKANLVFLPAQIKA